jgi:hypothetical protein
MRNTQQQLGTWRSSGHLLEDRGKPIKPLLGSAAAQISRYIV